MSPPHSKKIRNDAVQPPPPSPPPPISPSIFVKFSCSKLGFEIPECLVNSGRFEVTVETINPLVIQNMISNR
ncbi:hypothetical protein L1987_84713 [Smallanthus sonchifolius]|uniref:Uncharacterized protein n=1 Tax=Smallanthus sonchifolius TaxID=185202 RepID=A0ACB8XTX8_9ASTR|nr:hypothetical protein L1987_84713 [Smallanthus sonchifolius]